MHSNSFSQKCAVALQLVISEVHCCCLIPFSPFHLDGGGVDAHGFFLVNGPILSGMSVSF